MTDIILDGNMAVSLVTTIPDISAPVAATVAAGTDISLLLTPDGLAGFDAATNWVPNAGLGAVFETQLPGTVSYGDMSLTFKWQAGADAIWAMLIRGYLTNIVIRRRIARATAWTAGQAAEVYPIVCGQYTPVPYERNSLARFKVPFGLSAEPNLRAVVA